MRLILLTSILPLFSAGLQAASVTFPVPAELRSDRFTATIDGRPTYVAHAATTYHFLNFELNGSAKISITAPSDNYWAKGVEVQPWRWNIRPIVEGRTISFTVPGPTKLSISRPGDHGAGAEMLFLFANAPETDAPKPGSPGVRYFGPGVYHQNIDVASGDTIYLAPGAVVFGGINIWGVSNAVIKGRGIIVYDGPQDPHNDEGWMHKPNWHVIVMDNAHHIQVSGITCIVRSRTWMIQMLDSRDITFSNVKVIGGCPGNANQDGMDWLGGGDTIIRDSFFRASDDVFALYGNWLGYSDQALRTPGHDVSNILVENSVLSTSISNIVRVSWPSKVFNSRNFVIRDSDVIHMGMGACKVPFGLLEIWDDPDGHGKHDNYAFEDIRLEDWYSLVQLRQAQPSIHNVTFKNIWAVETSSRVRSVLAGDISDVKFQHVDLASRPVKNNGQIPLDVGPGTAQPGYNSEAKDPLATFTYSSGELKPGQPVVFDATQSVASSGRIESYEWQFGDGTHSDGPTVQHAFPDTEGTLWDGSGRFRVMLKVTDSVGKSDATYQPVVIANSYNDATATQRLTDGLNYKYFVGNSDQAAPEASGTAEALDVSVRKRAENYALVFDGYLNVPATGGYTFLLLANDSAKVEIDAQAIAVSPPPKAQVCGAIGNLVQLTRASVGLKAGEHRIKISLTHALGPDGFSLKWQGPGIPLSDIPASALKH